MLDTASRMWGELETFCVFITLCGQLKSSKDFLIQ